MDNEARRRRRQAAAAIKRRGSLMQEFATLRKLRTFSRDDFRFPRAIALLAEAEHTFLRLGKRRFTFEGYVYRIAVSNIGRLVVWDQLTGEDLVASFAAIDA